MAGRPTLYSPEMLEKAKEYLANTVDVYNPLTKSWEVHLPKAAGLAMYLGVVKSTLYEWAQNHKEFSDMLNEINQAQEERVIDRAMQGTYNATIAKLVLAKHGYHDAQEHLGKGGNDLKINLINYGDNNSSQLQTTPLPTDISQSSPTVQDSSLS